MSNKNLSLRLHKREDGDGETYYIAKLECPIKLDFENGVTFLVFLADGNQEELQIAKMDKKKSDDPPNRRR